MAPIAESELILNADGSVYHLRLQPEELAPVIIVVGDPGRVPEISKYFDQIEMKRQNREIVTHTGRIGNHRLTVLSTGMGTDNLDIVMNELDALVNIDLVRREPLTEHKSLKIIRLGTSGALQADIPVDSFVMSTYGIGMDGLLYFYADNEKVTDKRLGDAFVLHTSWNKNLPGIYAVKASESFMQQIGDDFIKGMTLTAPGFYGPQGRVLRMPLAYPQLNELIETFRYQGTRIANFEMETSALYGLGRMLGHETLTVCAIVANRVSRTYSKDAHFAVDKLVQIVLRKLTE
ncbi:MAG: nucleoside phosphorylase [Bacteroidales bacterium]